MNWNLALRAFRAGCLALILASCAAVGDPETPEEKLAAEEIIFQGVQTSIQTLGGSGVITKEAAPCVSRANAAAHSALVAARAGVAQGLPNVSTLVSQFSAALLSVKDILAKIETGEEVTCLP